MTDLGSSPQKGSYKYTVYQESGNVKALNTLTNNVESVNTDAATVIQYAINNIGAGIGSVFIKAGTYTLSTTVTVKSKNVIVGEGSESTSLIPTGNFDALSLANSATEVVISDLFLSHNQSAYTKSLINITTSCYGVSINNCHFYDNAQQKGFCISITNGAAANAFIGINDIKVTNCYSYGFEAFLNYVITNGGTSWSTANYIQDAHMINCKIDNPVRAVRTSCGANAVISRADAVACNVECSAATVVVFDYDGGGIYLYTTHVDTAAWDLPGGINYANVGDMGTGAGGTPYINLIGSTPNFATGKIGGSGVATCNIRTEWDKNLTETMTNKTVKTSILQDSQIWGTHTTGFENIVTFSLDNSPGDGFSLDNNSNVATVFAPLFRGQVTSASSAATDIPLWMQGVVTAAHDTGTSPCVVFSGKHSNNTAITTRPILSIYNLFSSIIDFNATNVDFKSSNELINANVQSEKNLMSGFLQNPVSTGRRTGMWIPIAGTTNAAIGSLVGILEQHVPTGAGSPTNTFDTTNGVIGNFVTGAVSGNAAGLVSPTAGVGVGRRLFGMRAIIRAQISTTANSKFLFGFTSATALPTAAATQPLATADHGVIVGYVETGTGGTNWSIWHNDGATSVTTDNVTGNIAKDALFHTIEIKWPAAGNITVTFDGTAQVISADLPATTANLFFNAIGVTTTTTARTFAVQGIYIEALR